MSLSKDGSFRETHKTTGILMKKHIFTYLIIGIVIVSNLWANTSREILELPDGTHYYPKKSEILTVFQKEDGHYKVDHVVDLNEDKKIIIAFKEKPICLSKNKRSLSKSALTNTHRKFESQLNELINSPNTLRKKSNFSSEYEITDKYYKVFNGVAMNCKRGLIGIIKNMSMVSHVYDDITLSVNLTKSVTQIRADIVRDSLGYTGKNVVVGILDTGIDYRHPALGGGFGPGYKVFGGYDFVNNDNDPMDDRGHGTHVAGIVAADGDSIVGVAPGVKLLAVKVMDASGEGYISDIIKGMEYCIDPDGNINTDDGVDILNMSFGEYTESPNPLDSIVSYIDKSGVLCVASAGNRWDEATIGTPGTAPEALTVGACNRNFSKSYFSSEGPDPIHERLKPEIVAPGTYIRSTVLGGRYEKHYGTSMAAPHVSGVAALVKEKNPTILPSDLKSIIVNNAQEIPGEKTYAVGNGCVNALRSIQDSLIINPGTISFGFADSRLSEWRDTATIVIKNRYSKSKHFQLTTTGISDNPIKINFSEQSLYLNSYEERKITIEIIVPGSVPVKNISPYTYSGNILCISNTDSTRIPFGFIRSSQLELHFDKPPYWVGVINQTTEESYSFYNINNKEIATRLPSGMYDLICIMTDSDHSKRYVVGKQNLSVNRYNEYQITYKDAKYDLIPKIYDYNDNILHSGNKQKCLYKHKLSHEGYSLSAKADYISSLDTSWALSTLYRYDSSDVSINIAHEIKGINSQSDLTIPSGSKNLVPYDFYYELPTNQKFQKQSCGLCINYSSGGWWFPFKSQSNHKKLYLSKTIENKYHKRDKSFQPMFQQIKDTTGSMLDGNNTKNYYGPLMRIDKNGGLTSYIIFRSVLGDWLFNSSPREIPQRLIINQHNPNSEIKFMPGSEVILPLQSEITINPSPNYYFPDYYKGPILEHNGTKVIISSKGNYVKKLKEFVNYNLYLNNIRYDDNDKSKVVKIYHGPLRYTATASHYFPLTYFPKLDSSLFNKQYKIIGYSPEYKIEGQKGISTVKNIFKYNSDSEMSYQQIIDIPVLQLFQIISSGEIVTSLKPGHNNYIHFKLHDREDNISEVRTALITNKGQKIPLFTEALAKGTEFKAQIPSDLPKEFIDVEIFVKDSSNSSTSFLASPGFYFGNSKDITHESRVHLVKYELKNSKEIGFNAGDKLKYTLVYKNIGNVPATEVYLTLPETNYFSPEEKTILLDRSLATDDSTLFNIELTIKQDMNEPTDISYFPEIHWKNNSKKCMREHSIFNSSMDTNYVTKAPVSYKYKLDKNYPNPFNNNTTINFALLDRKKVTISVYNIRGEKIKILTNKEYSKGYYSVNWDGRDINGVPVSSGVYFYQMTTRDGFVKNYKMVYIK